MLSRAKAQRIRKSQGGRWTPESLKRLYDLRNTYSHLSWREFYQKNFFPGRSFYFLVKTYSSYKQKLAASRKARRMQAAASISRPGLHTPSSRVVKRPGQPEKDPRLRNRKQARLDTSPEHNNPKPSGSEASVQEPSLDPSFDTDHESGDILHSGRTEKFPKSSPQARTNENKHAGPNNVSSEPNPKPTPNTAELLEPAPEQQSRPRAWLPPKMAPLPHTSKAPGASSPGVPAPAQIKGPTPRTQHCGQKEATSAKPPDNDLEQAHQAATLLVEQTTKWRAERQTHCRLQVRYKSLQTKHSALEKEYHDSQQLISSHKTKIEQLQTENKQFYDEIARRDQSSEECSKMREMLATKEEELATKDEELAEKKEELIKKDELISKLKTILLPN